MNIRLNNCKCTMPGPLGKYISEGSVLYGEETDSLIFEEKRKLYSKNILEETEKLRDKIKSTENINSMNSAEFEEIIIGSLLSSCYKMNEYYFEIGMRSGMNLIFGLEINCN